MTILPKQAAAAVRPLAVAPAVIMHVASLPFSWQITENGSKRRLRQQERLSQLWVQQQPGEVCSREVSARPMQGFVIA
jgi:hypothetical protein